MATQINDVVIEQPAESEGTGEAVGLSSGKIPGLEVEFDGCPSPFFAVVTVCTNPECDCREVRLAFVERGDERLVKENATRFAIRLDLDSWGDNEEKERPARVQDLVDRFLHDLPEKRKTKFRGFYDEQKTYARRGARYSMPVADVLEGKLVPYSDVYSETGSVTRGGHSYGFAFEHGGKRYLVEDLYCPDPDCDCENVLLVFMAEGPEDSTENPPVTPLLDVFDVSLGLGGEIEQLSPHSCSETEARDLLSRWRETEPDLLGIATERYLDIKALGRRVLDEDELAQEIGRSPRVRKAPKVGRNDLCPCGSGKKFKKCCLGK